MLKDKILKFLKEGHNSVADCVLKFNSNDAEDVSYCLKQLLEEKKIKLVKGVRTFYKVIEQF